MKCSDCGAPVRPVVAFDIDGTLGDYHTSFAEFAERYLGTGERFFPRHWDGIGEFRERLGIPLADYRQMKLAHRTGGFKRWMAPYMGARALVEAAQKMGCEVWMTTTRPWMRLDNIDPDTREWLRRNKIPYDHILFDEDKYKVLTEMVDPARVIMVLDDEAVQRDRCLELGLPFVLRNGPWNWKVEHDISSNNLIEIEAILMERVGVHDALKA